MNTQKQFKTRRSFVSALVALVTAGFGPKTAEYNAHVKQGYRHGKHNGRTVGAFGGPKSAKSHRRLFVSAI